MEQFLTSLAPSVEASFLSGTADCGEGEATHLIRLRREAQKSRIKTCFEGLIHFENVTNVLCQRRSFLSLFFHQAKKKGSICAQAALTI